MGWGGVGSQKKKHSCKVQGEEQKLGKEEGEGKKYHEPAKKKQILHKQWAKKWNYAN